MTAHALTTADFEAAAFGEKAKGIFDLVKLIGGLDMGKLRDALGAIRDVQTAPDAKGRVKAGLQVLKLIASLTPNTNDDKLAGAIDAVLTDQLIDVLTRLVGGLSGNAQAQDVTLTAQDRATAQAAGIPWAFLVRIGLQLVELFGSIKQPATA